MSHETGRRWGFLIAEAILIVVSILMAFAIDAWWDGRTEDHQRRELFAALEADFTQTAQDLDEKIAQSDSIVARSGGFLDAIRRGGDVDQDSLVTLFNAIGEVVFFSPTVHSYRTAIATGAIELVRSPEIVRLLGEFDQALRIYELHLETSAELFYTGAVQDFRRAGGSVDDPEARRTGVFAVVLGPVDLRGGVAESTAEPIYTVQYNMGEQLRLMRSAASELLEELRAR